MKSTYGQWAAGRRTLRRVSAELRAAIRAARTRGTTMGSQAAHVVRRRGGRAVGGADARVVLRATPREADTRVANRIPLHLIYSHFGGMSVHKLHKTTTFAGGDFDVCDLSEPLEE